MIPSRMLRIRIFVPKEFYDEVITFLGESESMQIEPIEENKESFSEYMIKNRDLIAEYSHRLNSLKLSLNKKPEKPIKISSLEQAKRLADRIKIDEKLKELHQQYDLLSADKKDTEYMLYFLNKIRDFNYDLSILNNSNVRSFLIGKDKFSEAIISKIGKDQIIIQLKNSTIISVSKDRYDEMKKLIGESKLNAIEIPRLKGKVDKNVEQLSRKISNIDKNIKLITKKIDTLSDRYYSIISTLSEYFDIEMQKINVLSKIGATTYLTAIEGWVEEQKVKQLSQSLGKITSNNYLIEETETKDEPPTKMNNPVSFRLYEFFVKFYSIPKSNEIDPTIFFGITFPIFFGLMIGDTGYGLFTLILSIWAIRRITKPPRRSMIPRWLSNFVHTLADNRSLLILFKAIIPGSIIAIVLGLIFNQFFGFSLPYHTLFNVTKNVLTLLLIAGYTGVSMVSFGFILGSVDGFIAKDKRRGLGKIGWLFLSLGIVILGLMILYDISITSLSLESALGYCLLIVGLVMIIKFDKVSSLMEIPSVISHILSYTRLLGILLASVILAEVINMGFLFSIKSSIFVLILGVILLIFGQLFNIVLALFEAGIQGARLIYVEFFSKFLIGNGRLFRPFSIKRKLTSNRYKNQVQ